RAGGKEEFGHRLPDTFGERARAVANALAAVECAADQRMGLKTLKFLERRQIRIGVVEVDNEADRDQTVAEMIKERAAADIVGKRPAHGVLHEPAVEILRCHLP